jgi:molybdopterin synthase catalytic subunit
MHAVVICGSGADRLAGRLADALAGRVGLVHQVAEDGGEPSGAGQPSAETSDGGAATRTASIDAADTTYRLGAESWAASGPGPSLRDAIERLAPDHDHALAVGFPEADLPKVVLGDEEPPGEVVTRVDDADGPTADVVTAIEETEPFETLESLVAEVKRAPDADRSGAIATFTGRVRARDDPDDDRTQYLEFEKYEAVAATRMRAIEDELAERDGVFEVRLHHRTGVIPDGEDIVFVVVLAGHREEAFRTVEDGINRLKDEVPIFKKEVTEAETFWVHARE